LGKNILSLLKRNDQCGDLRKMNQVTNAGTSDSDWKSLYKVGAVAALIAGVIFRRNLGVEIALFSAQKEPDTIIDWFTLLHTRVLSASVRDRVGTGVL
jgi:hypothetical protein